MEKFCLKWNDFQTNVTKTFSSLRQEEHLFDVTLVSDDEQHIAAHKLVLSASSDLFKNILKKASHSNPMIFLSGFKSTDLYLILDYIYQGEVQILQSDLDGFLDAAQRLKIEGLIGGDNDSDEHSFPKNEDKLFNMKQDYAEVESTGMSVLEESINGSLNQETIVKRRLPRAEKAIVSTSANSDAKVAVDDLVEETDNSLMLKCKSCGKIGKRSDIRRHAEIHIEGLSFDCQLCDKTFRSRKALLCHKQRNHN